MTLVKKSILPKRLVQKVHQINNKDVFTKLRTTGIYLLVPIVNFSVSVFTSPVFARYLTAEEFGYFGYYNSISTFLMVFFSLSFSGYYMSVYFRETEQKRKAILSSLVLFIFLWNLLFFPIAYFGVYLYFILSDSQIPFYPFALLIFGAGSLSVYKAFVQIDYRLGQKPFYYFLYVSGYRVLAIFVSLFFVIYPEMGLEGRMIGILITEVLFFIFSFRYVLKGQKIKIDKQIIKNAFKVILPLLPATLFYLPLGSYDNIVLGRLNEPVEMGFYNIGKGIATYLYTALFPFYQAFEPDIYKHAVERSTKNLLKIGMALIILVFSAVVMFWIVSPFLIDYLTAGKYTEATSYANIMAVTSGLMIIFSIFDAIIIALHETKKSLIINAITAVISISLYTIMGIYYKQIGVAIGTVVTYFILVTLQSLFVISKFKISKSN